MGRATRVYLFVNWLKKYIETDIWHSIFFPFIDRLVFFTDNHTDRGLRSGRYVRTQRWMRISRAVRRVPMCHWCYLSTSFSREFLLVMLFPFRQFSPLFLSSRWFSQRVGGDYSAQTSSRSEDVTDPSLFSRPINSRVWDHLIWNYSFALQNSFSPDWTNLTVTKPRTAAGPEFSRFTPSHPHTPDDESTLILTKYLRCKCKVDLCFWYTRFTFSF